MISQNNTKNKSFSKQYFEYLEYVNTLNIKEESKDWRLKHIRGFDIYLRANDIDFQNLSKLDVYNYMDSISNLSSRTKENRAVCIRMFLDFLHEKAELEINGRETFPTIVSTKYSTIPSYYADEEIMKVINSVDITSLLGKRDYAMLLILTTYGIRQKDLINLSYSNINWNDNKIIIIQSKDNNVNEFPLTKEIRYAILDYLKNGRPKSDLPYIFLTRDGSKFSSGSCYNIVNKYFKKSNINIGLRHHGVHAFRHSLATSLLTSGIGIDEISAILGHDDVASTEVYARVNFNELKKLSLEVPKWYK